MAQKALLGAARIVFGLGRAGTVLLLAAMAVLVVGGSASATVSGTNGPLAFVRYVTCSSNPNFSGARIFRINLDTSGLKN